ncbi:hypothetical protein ADUPG1_003227, partial [Aduncisulcus paluster]
MACKEYEPCNYSIAVANNLAYVTPHYKTRLLTQGGLNGAAKKRDRFQP